MFRSQVTSQGGDVLRMSHTFDPDTSKDAARRAKRGHKVETIQSAIVYILTPAPKTAKEVHRLYDAMHKSQGWPAADLQDIRRRMTELEHDLELVAPTEDRRNGERVMAVSS